MLDPGNFSGSGAWRRKAQLDKWEESDTASASSEICTASRVSFTPEIAFMAACSQSDMRECKLLLKKGVRPDAANIDGLTPLHQAAIDDNINMVKFLVESGANVNVTDKEGWTPLHATASCGYIDIAQYLIAQGADLSSVNSDGDLCIDIADTDDMSSLISKEMSKQSINADEARNAEERMMLKDAENWRANPSLPELEDPQHGATALIIACAKGYVRCLTILIQAGANLNHQDVDGWTGAHAAAHWAQEEALKILALAGASLDIPDYSGMLPYDLGDRKIQKLLKELILKQQQCEKESENNELIVSNERNKHGRRTSITRFSAAEKDALTRSNSLEEKALLSRANSMNSPNGTMKSILKRSNSVKEDGDSCGEEKSEDNEMIVNNNDDDESTSTQLDNKNNTQSDESQASYLVYLRPKLGVRQPRGSSLPPRLNDAIPEINNSDYASFKDKLQAFKRASASEPPINDIGTVSNVPKTTETTNNDNVENISKPQSYDSTDGVDWSKSNDGSKRAFAHIKSSGSGSTASTYIPYYKRKQMERENKEREAAAVRETVTEESTLENKTVNDSSINHTSNTNDTRLKSTKPTIQPNQPITTPSQPSQPAPLTNDLEQRERRRSRFDPPSRDEATETRRKQKAKRARETRRSTQGVTQEDVLQAEATLKTSTNVPPAPPNRPTELSKPAPSPASQAMPPPSVPAPLQLSASTSSVPETETARRQRGWQRENPPTPKEDGSRSSFRKAREAISGNLSTENSLSSSYGGTGITNDNTNDDSESRRLTSRQRRLKNKERRSTGICQLEEPVKDEDKEADTSEEAIAANGLANSRGSYTTRRYASTSDVPNSMSGTGYRSRSRPLSEHATEATPETRQQSSSAPDYKKMYEDALKNLAANEEAIKQLRAELSTRQPESSLSDKREIRNLQRRVAQLEEELKTIDTVKTENAKLKEENGALIRVISKLSK